MVQGNKFHNVGYFCWLAAILILSISLLLPGGCKREESAPTPARVAAAKTPVVYTTFYPTTYFAERIGRDQIQVVNPCPLDADPAFWMPDEKTIEAYQKADLIVINGASFEKWLGKVTLPESRIVDTSAPFADEFIVIEETVTHSHGPAGAHSHAGVDGHTWLDPINARTQANEIRKSFIKRFPDHKEIFEQGYAELAKGMDALDARLAALTAKIGDQVLLCSHPAYNYVGRRYGWHLKNFHLNPEAMPDKETLDKIKACLENQPAKYMLWEAKPTEEIAAKFRESLGLENIVFSPCEALDPTELEAGEDFLTVMSDNVDRLDKALGD
jgi:zinc transport system substrate-binding protein